MPDEEINLYRFTTQDERLINRVKSLEVGNLRLRRGSYGPITGPLSRVSNDFFTSVGNIDTTKTGVRKLGSVPPSNNTTGFAYTATTTSITWYWDGTNGSFRVILRRADNTVEVIPSGSQSVSGLTPNTTYYFFPFWTPNNKCTIGWVQGTVGNPQIAFVLADINDPDVSPAAANQQTLQDREPLSAGAMTAATTAAGTGGGGAGGGGGHGTGCVMAGTDIQPLGDHFYAVEVIPETNWLRIQSADKRILNCTLDHPLYHADKGKVQAQYVEKGDFLITEDGKREVVEVTRFLRSCSKRKVMMKEGHLYWANGFLSSNAKYNPA